MVSPSCTVANAPAMSDSLADGEMATQRPVPVQSGLLEPIPLLELDDFELHAGTTRTKAAARPSGRAPFMCDVLACAAVLCVADGSPWRRRRGGNALRRGDAHRQPGR